MLHKSQLPKASETMASLIAISCKARGSWEEQKLRKILGYSDLIIKHAWSIFKRRNVPILKRVFFYYSGTCRKKITYFFIYM